MNKTKYAIFQSAIKIFSTSGYNGATMDEVALTAGVAKGTLYYHFKSKEEIFRYIIVEGMNVIKEQIQSAIKGEDSPILKLKLLCRVQLNMVYENRDFFKVVMSQLWGKELRQLELRIVIRDYINFIEKFIIEAIESGDVKKGESSFMAYTFFGTLCSAAIYELMNEEKSKVEDVADSLVQYILNGIAI